MLPYSAVFALLLAFRALAQDSLHPWEITRLVVSGAPYRSEAACYKPLATIAVEIRDPNRYAGENSSGSDMTQCITAQGRRDGVLKCRAEFYSFTSVGNFGTWGLVRWAGKVFDLGKSAWALFGGRCLFVFIEGGDGAFFSAAEGTYMKQ
ncbi:hypothetical protein V8F06_013827 [Rhypophila decipiens]